MALMAENRPSSPDLTSTTDLLRRAREGDAQALDDLIGKLEARVASWMTDVELPKADRRHRHKSTG